jgi:hypothetical protein
MPSSAEKVAQLRTLLAERFGSASSPKQAVCQTGLPALDALEIPVGALTEIVGMAAPHKGGGLSLLLYALLRAWLAKERAVLVDGRNAFAPNGLRQEELNRLLWLRCKNASEAIKSADLIVRDGNLPLVILLLVFNPPSEMRRIPATAWHRLQMLAEKSGSTVLIFTQESQVQCAQLRLGVGGCFPLQKLHRMPADFALKVQRRRLENTKGGFNEGPSRMVCDIIRS